MLTLHIATRDDAEVLTGNFKGCAARVHSIPKEEGDS